MSEAISIENLTVSYGSTPALQNINLKIEEKEFLGIMGPNGGGKSTLLKAVLGLIPVLQGKITIMGKPQNEGRKLIGYVPQFSNMDRSFPISAIEVVLSGMLSDGLHPFFSFKPSHRDEAMHCLEKVNLKDLAKRQINDLSGGEFQRLLIARALATKPSMLMLDEPTANVDPSSTEQIYSLLTELNKNTTIILVTHDLMTIASNLKRIVCINHGIIYHGEPKLTEKIVNELYGCPVDLIAHGVPHRVLGDHSNGGCN